MLQGGCYHFAAPNEMIHIRSDHLKPQQDKERPVGIVYNNF